MKWSIQDKIDKHPEMNRLESRLTDRVPFATKEDMDSQRQQAIERQKRRQEDLNRLSPEEQAQERQAEREKLIPYVGKFVLVRTGLPG